MFKLGIYKILNKITGKVYVGSTVNLSRRWLDHKKLLRRNRHYNILFQRSWNKYGEEAFEFIIIEYCLKEFLIMREQYWIDKLGACDSQLGYNLAIVAGSTSGYKLSEATKFKMREAVKNRTEEHKSKLGFSNKGRKLSEETKLKMRLAKLGKKNSPETIEKMRKAKQNMSAETIAKMTKANKERAERNKILFGRGI